MPFVEAVPAAVPRLPWPSLRAECCRLFSSLSRRPLRARLSPSMDHQVHRRHKKHRYYHRDSQSSNYRPGQWRILFAALLNSERHRCQSQQRSERGHQNGPQTHLASLHYRLLELEPSVVQNPRKLHDQYAVRHHDPRHHDHSHQRHDVQRRVRHPQKRHHSREPRRYRRQNNERIDERPELRHQNQVHEHDREDQADSKPEKRLFHAHNRPLHPHPRVLRQRQPFQYLIHLPAHPAEVFALRHHVHINHPPDLIVVHLRRCVDRLDLRYRLQRRILRRCRRPQRYVPKVRHRHRIDLLVEILHRQHVVVPALRIDPVARRDHPIRRQRRDHVVHYVFRRQPQQTRLLAIDVQLQPRIIDVLRDQHVAHPLRPLQLQRDLPRDPVPLPEIVVAHLDVQRRRQSLVHHRIHQPPRLKIRAQFRQIVRQLPPHSFHVFITPHLVIFLQVHLHKRRVHPGVRRVNRRQVRRDSDVRHDHLEFALRYHRPYVLLHPRDVFVGNLQPRP